MNWKGRAGYILAAAFLVIMSCSGCSLHPESSFDRNGVAMDTTISLKATGKEAKEAVNESFQRIEEIDKLANAQNPESDVSKINAAAGKEYVQVDPAIYEMLEFSQAYSEKTNGLWDISVGIMTKLWQIGNEGQHIPTNEEIQQALLRINYRDILLRPEDHSVMLAKEGMVIDLGGIAKGYAVDEVRAIYAKHHIENGLINMGASSMYALGTNSKGKAWNIGMKHPRSDKSDTFLGIVAIEDEYLSTSGDYERYFIQDGVRYCHIFDVRTGYPAQSGVMSDSVVIDASVPYGGMISDMVTTIIFVLGPQKGLDFVNGMDGVECEITDTNGAIYMTDGFKTHFSDMNRDFHAAN